MPRDIMQDEKLPPEQLESSLLCLDLADLLWCNYVNVNNGNFQPSIRRWTRPGPIPDELEQHGEHMVFSLEGSFQGCQHCNCMFHCIELRKLPKGMEAVARIPDSADVEVNSFQTLLIWSQFGST